VTETDQQALPVADSTPVETAAQNGTAADQNAPAKRQARSTGRRSSLNTMLLPELQQVAAGLGISTAKKKKSDLIAAIQSARSGSAAPANGVADTVRPAAETTAAVATAPAPATSENGTRATTRSRRRATSAPAEKSGGGASSAQVAPTETPAPQSNAGAAPDRQPREDKSAQAGTERDGAQRDSSPREQGGQQQGDRQQGDRQQGDRQRSSGDDDYDGGGSRRRGRRYRDRRGRNRDRSSGGSSQGDAEPTVNEDDVLIPVAGVVDTVEEKNTWFVRVGGFYATSDDVYIANSLVRRYGLRRGDAITGAVRQPREGERREKYNPLVRLDTVNGQDPEQARNRVEFTKLTPLYPQERLRLETEPHIFTTRVIDLVMPIGKGQRALIVSPPKAGKTSVLQAIANAIATNNPECHLMVVLVDERPEEVTDMQRSVKGEVIASTFDRRPQDHTMVAELSIERAKRLVELGHDVVVLLDSITRLGRAYNLAAPASGRILSGGVDSTALYPPKRFLGAARNIEHGGSLTILATALVETGSAGDTVIFEEFKGTGNAELRLRRDIADKRIFPAVDVDQSSTRKEELLLSPDELAVTIKLRRVLHSLDPQQAIDLLLDRLRKTRTNYEFLTQIARTTPGQDSPGRELRSTRRSPRRRPRSGRRRGTAARSSGSRCPGCRAARA
jgi:transcription termination factor Rho